MPSWIDTPAVASLLDSLYADAAERDRREPASPPPAQREAAPEAEAAHYRRMRHRYMAVGREFGRMLYGLVRATQARTVVEFGTSFGISTIYLASAVRDVGQITGRAGRVISTEFEPEKATQARKNLAIAGLAELVEVRVGDALKTLRADVPPSIDVVFLDGAKSLYLDVLRLLEPRLRSGAIVASDNTDYAGVESLLAHVRDAANGYTSSAFVTTDRARASGHELSIRV